MLKINLNDNDIKIPPEKIGIDMGQSLTKFAYLDGDDLSLSLFNTQSDSSDINTHLNSLRDQFKYFNFTGGRSYELFTEYSKEVNSSLINEFEANMRGIEFLYKLEKKNELSRSLIVCIGTGTSIVLKNNGFQHLGGSALGGGFFMGIIKTVFNLNDFHEAIELAKRGNRYNVDLKVSDIYHPADKRIDLIFREFTAASLGKINENFNMQSLNKEDFINSIICLIGENLGTIADAIANNHSVKKIVFCGGLLRENRILKKILSLICKVNGKNGIFLKKSEFCAAIGTLLI